MGEEKNTGVADNWPIPEALGDALSRCCQQGPKPEGARLRASARQCMNARYEAGGTYVASHRDPKP